MDEMFVNSKGSKKKNRGNNDTYSQSMMKIWKILATLLSEKQDSETMITVFKTTVEMKQDSIPRLSRLTKILRN